MSKLSTFLIIFTFKLNLFSILSIKLKRQGENTVVEYKISMDASLNYYLPYFHKAGFIFFPDTTINYKDISTNCDDRKCHYCNTLYPDLCYKCATGYYLKGKSCEFECPKGYITDVLRQKCKREEEVDNTIVFSKTYTIGSCFNKCGNSLVRDCSCSIECKKTGTCCYDYTEVNCDSIFDKGKSALDECKATNINCDFCDNNIRNGNKLKCNQCKSNYYLYNGECISSCPVGTKADSDNSICKDIISCSVDNCSECKEGSITTCKKCNRGNFLHNGLCIKICPLGYRADRISWSCLEYPVFSWYYVFPSRGSCKNACGGESVDCKCDTQCIRRGDCCQDFSDVCVKFAIVRKSNFQ